MVFYESPYRLVKTLEDLAGLFGPDREASVARELTKVFEENIRGNLAFLTDHFKTSHQRAK
jgi:16S rRNA (cytidine1402-2'-O)-methyltransferase